MNLYEYQRSRSLIDHGPRSFIFRFFKDLLQNRLAYQSQISYGALVGWGNESLFAESGSHDLVAATPIYGKSPSKIFFSTTKGPMTLWFAM